MGWRPRATLPGVALTLFILARLAAEALAIPRTDLLTPREHATALFYADLLRLLAAGALLALALAWAARPRALRGAALAAIGFAAGLGAVGLAAPEAAFTYRVTGGALAIATHPLGAVWRAARFAPLAALAALGARVALRELPRRAPGARLLAGGLAGLTALDLLATSLADARWPVARAFVLAGCAIALAAAVREERAAQALTRAA